MPADDRREDMPTDVIEKRDPCPFQGCKNTLTRHIWRDEQGRRTTRFVNVPECDGACQQPGDQSRPLSKRDMEWVLDVAQRIDEDHD